MIIIKIITIINLLGDNTAAEASEQREVSRSREKITYDFV